MNLFVDLFILIYIYIYIYGWQLIRLGYRMCFHMYDEKKRIYIYIYIYCFRKNDVTL